MKPDPQTLKSQRDLLDSIAVQLKSEFFGLDTTIDKVISSIYSWYVFPGLVTRPVIINLWGMTGVGKTQLVRRLVTLLGYHDKFVEVQMDGFSGAASWAPATISGCLSESMIEEGQQGILLLDEIQRYRTKDERGAQVETKKYQDVWQLLSDGKFALDASTFRDIESMIFSNLYDQDRKKDDDPEEDDDDTSTVVTPRKFKMGPWEARRLKRILRLTQTVPEIMAMTPVEVQELLDGARTARDSWQTDYSKLLIFVCGNLDEAFPATGSLEDCDTDADIYHEMTSKITISDIKKALGNRFAPEQISRLGNNHIIYPSLSKDSYEKLIHHHCDKYVSEMEALSGVHFTLDPQVYQEIYDNSVFPTQGTRPVFSSIHNIFSTALSNLAVWALENDIEEDIHITLDVKEKLIQGTTPSGATKDVVVDLALRATREKATLDFKTVVAVHEAGHALVYALLTSTAPKEIKINLASFTGGYMAHNLGTKIFRTKKEYVNMMQVSYAGAAAEEVVFGGDLRANGCGSDFTKASAMASSYYRDYGFGDDKALIYPSGGRETEWALENPEETFGVSSRIRSLCNEQYREASKVIKAHIPELRVIVQALLGGETIGPERFQELLPGIPVALEGHEAPYHAAWEAFINPTKE